MAAGCRERTVLAFFDFRWSHFATSSLPVMPLPVARSRHCAGIQKCRAGRQVTRQTQAHLNSCRQLDQVSVAIFPRTFAENAHTNEDTGQARVCSTGLRDCTTQHAALTVITNTGERASATEDNRGGGGVGGLLARDYADIAQPWSETHTSCTCRM